jgi:MerR family transcriptional regulator, light-induced transcriptional regulator
MASLERATKSSCYAKPGPFAKTSFAVEQKSPTSDMAERQRRLASVISQEIIPRLMLIHHKVLKPCEREPNGPSEREIEELAHLVLGPDVQAAANYVLRLRQRGLSLDLLYIELLEPAARLLGKMWDDDRCDFVDVTLGVARLQELLAIFNDTNCVSTFGDMRRVITGTTCGEQHRFGLAMVEKFLRASGWHVRSESGCSVEAIAAAVQSEWFAVAGFTLSCESRLDALAATIKTVRERSCNKSIGVMVGGPVFNACPELAIRVGADAAALNAPTAVLLAQKLFDLGVASRVQASTVA